MNKLLTFDPRKNKYVLVGEIIGNTLFKDVNTRHYMRILDGYGIQEPAFQEALSKGIKFIVIKVFETGDKWKSTKEDWLLHGKLADYGNGKQRFLSMKFMHKYNPLEVTKEQQEKEVERDKSIHKVVQGKLL